MLTVHPPAGRLKIAATYKILQPIENFVLRIKIVEQKSPLAELFEIEGETEDDLLVEERNVGWQEKIFSPREMKFYADEKNCTTDLHKEYREVILGSRTTDKSRVYTCTQRDSYCPDTSILTTNHVSSLAKRNENAMPAVKNRKPFAKRYNKKVVEARPSESLTRGNHCLYKCRTSMHIFVDLSSKDHRLGPDDSADDRTLELSPDSQILLCALTHDRAAGTLTIDPDFANEDCRYSLETSDLLYDYWIEHASSTRPSDDLSKQRRELFHLETREKRAYGEENIFQEIALPPANVLRSFVNLEILSARDFDYDRLFVTYHVNLPRHWASSETERLTGRTQRSRVLDGKAHFAYVSEIPLDFDLNSLKTAIGQQPRAWPYFIFTVGSIDHWTRYRIEGYASVPLPPSPGCYSFDLTTWRPLGRFVNTLRRFFTGGTAELEDLTYCGIPSEISDDDSTRLEKSRLKVTPGGSIRINLNIVRQSKIFAKNHQSLCRDVLERTTSAGTLINTLDNVLEQFKAARDRMIHARAQ